MDTLRGIVVVIHLIGFGMLFGAWAVEVFNRRMRVTRLMQIGLAIAGLAGLILAIPFGIDYDLNYIKLGVKLFILIVIGALLGIGQARQRKDGAVPPAIFWSVGILTLATSASPSSGADRGLAQSRAQSRKSARSRLVVKTRPTAIIAM